MKDWMRQWRRLLVRVGLLPPAELHYIGGSDTLPPPLSREREAELLERIGEEDARKELIEHNLRLVVYIARRFENTGVGIEDLISIGTIGLIKAVGTYRTDKNIKLATYASRCIENEILMYLPANAVSGSGYMLWQAAFSFLFFAVVLFFSLRPGEIMTWIGKVLNPVFLVMLGILVLRALSAPMGTPGDMVPESAYESGAFFTGLLEGYNTMDALAGLAFGIVVIDVIRGLGVKEPGQIARGTVKAGIFSSLFMAVIYLLVTLVGAQSRGQLETAPNGGEALAQIADYYFGGAGMLILAVLVTVACLKTAIGLTTSCSETFCAMFPGGPGYRIWAVGFATLSFLTANLGLDAIIAYAVPVLMFLYPLAIVLVLLTLCGKWFDNDGTVLRWTLGFTGVAAMVDFLRTLPEGTKEFLHISGVTELAETWIPLAGQGLGWALPAGIGLVIGLLIRRKRQRKAAG